MPLYTLADLVDQETGAVNLRAYRSITRRRALADDGVICPKSIRSASRGLRQIILDRQTGWRIRNGLPVASTAIPFDLSNRADGVRREA